VKSDSFTSPAENDQWSRDCAAVDVQVIGRKAHSPTSLNGWVGCQNEAVCESSCRDFKILQSRVHNLNIGMSVDQFKSVWESLISILLDGNTEAAFNAELVTAVSTEIGMGFVPISICWQTMNGNLIPGVALGAVFFKGAGSFAWIVAHCCSPSF